MNKRNTEYTICPRCNLPYDQHIIIEKDNKSHWFCQDEAIKFGITVLSGRSDQIRNNKEKSE